MWQFATINETLTIVFIFSVSHFLATLRSVYIKLVRYLKLALLLLREHIYASSLSMFEHFKYQSCHIDFINCIKMHCNVRIVVVTLMFLGVVQRSSFSSSWKWQSSAACTHTHYIRSIHEKTQHPVMLCNTIIFRLITCSIRFFFLVPNFPALAMALAQVQVKGARRLAYALRCFFVSYSM